MIRAEGCARQVWMSATDEMLGKKGRLIDELTTNS